MSGGLAEIRGWLVKGESSEAWLGICRILEGLEVSEQEMCVSYVSQHTKGWGESIRRPLYGWWEKHRRGEWTGFEDLVGDWSRYVWEEERVAGEVREVASVAGMRMRWIPAGTFWMGSDEYDFDVPYDEKPRREVTMTRGFWMMETLVTQGQYLAVVGYNPSFYAGFSGYGYGLESPVENVSWDEAAEFANKLSAMEGVSESFVAEGEDEEMEGVGNKRSDYVGSKGWRLPTEAEWEYACRAGTTTSRYGDLDKIAWYNGNIGTRTFTVGQKQANAWGLYDTLGNLWEWCYDWFGSYEPADAATDPVGSVTGEKRVIRGGCYDNIASLVRAAQRDCESPMRRYDHIGFRLVRLGA